MLKKLTKKQISNGLLFLGFTAVMLFLLTRTDIMGLIDDVARQAWIFFSMLFLRFGEENIWRPTLKNIASDDDK